MGITAFDSWSSRVVHSMPLTALKNSFIGIDAAYYLEHLLTPPKETVLAGTGGWPLALEAIIAKEIEDFQSVGCRVHFVFNGLDYGIKDNPFAHSIKASVAIEKAFKLYEENMAPEAVEIFKNAGVPTPAMLSDFLKMVLHNHNIEFTVAPYSALAQLAYYEKDPSQFIDAIWGPSELFMYGVDKLITKIGLVYDMLQSVENGSPKKYSTFNMDASNFSWIDRRECLEQLSHIPPVVFIDACLLAGSSLLDTFPPLRDPELYPQGYTFRDVVNLIMSCGRSVTTVCTQYQNDKDVKRLDYLDRYRRAIIGVKHHIVVTKVGNVETLDAVHAPSDVHDCIGQRLPEELNMYLFRGMIRPRVLNWLTSGTILVTAPRDGGDSPVFQNLVKEQLRPWRQQAICLLADSINRYYQQKEVTTKFWFGEQHDQRFTVRDLLPSKKLTLRSWRVKDHVIAERQQAIGASSEDNAAGALYCALRSLAEVNFASGTIAPKPAAEDSLKTTREIVANVIWRFLQLREYVDEKHQLTPWGRVLETTLEALGSEHTAKQAEAAFLAVELLRLGLLDPDTMFPNYSGAPLRRTETDRRSCMLVARVASLGKLHHKAKGYSGPLSRHLLAYGSIVSEVRSGLRDLIEMILVSLYLEGEAERERNDWMDISLSLPFYEDISCALGIIVKTYLDELHTLEEPTSEACRAEMKARGEGWLAHADFEHSFNDALQLWDAIYEGVTTLSDGMFEKKGLWNEVNQWLSQRR